MRQIDGVVGLHEAVESRAATRRANEIESVSTLRRDRGFE